MLRVVFDTNVYISAFMTPGGKARDAFLLAVEGKVELYASVAILTETAGKLREKFLWNDARITAALKLISRVATVLKTAPRLNILADEADNRVLECAKESGSHIIVTGDRHLLGLKEYEGIGITRIAGFLYSFFK